MSEHRTSDREYSLLPTPAVAHTRNHDEPIENYLQRRQDYTNGKTKGMPGASLGVALRLAFEGKSIDGTEHPGRYDEAIVKWEDETRPAPVTLGEDGFLNEGFVSWMMGLPDGWLDAEGVSRKDKMILCGNGVVPQQAEAAIKELLITIGASDGLIQQESLF
jgi:DNA (cytosine-5)-methyltransferase 1